MHVCIYVLAYILSTRSQSGPECILSGLCLEARSFAVEDGRKALGNALLLLISFKETKKIVCFLF